MSSLHVPEPRGPRDFHTERARELLERALAGIYGPDEVIAEVSEALANLRACDLTEDERAELQDLAEAEA